MSEDFDEDDAYEWGECEQCGKSKRVIYTCDPWYDEGLTDDGEATLWCHKCYQERFDDI